MRLKQTPRVLLGAADAAQPDRANSSTVIHHTMRPEPSRPRRHHLLAHPRGMAYESCVASDFEGANLERALTAFESLGFQPRAPIPLRDFADSAKRREWVASKNLVVLSLWSPRHPATEVDVFVEPPFPFDEAFSRSLRADLGVAAALVVSKADLIAMKRHAGRPKDLEDIRALTLLSDAPTGASGERERDG